MPVAHLFNNDVLMFKAQGEVTVNDFYGAWGKIKADPYFHPPIDLLIDLRKAHIDLPGQEIEGAVDHLRHKGFFNKIAFVAERGSFTYAMGRMFCIKAEYLGFRSEIFLSKREAITWLNDDSPDDSLHA